MKLEMSNDWGGAQIYYLKSTCGTGKWSEIPPRAWPSSILTLSLQIDQVLLPSVTPRYQNSGALWMGLVSNHRRPYTLRYATADSSAYLPASR
jgi:hypothetical protein